MSTKYRVEERKPRRRPAALLIILAAVCVGLGVWVGISMQQIAALNEQVAGLNAQLQGAEDDSAAADAEAARSALAEAQNEYAALKETEAEIMATWDGSGSSWRIYVTANGAWTAEADRPWMKLGSTSGNGNATLTVEMEQNPSAASRTGTVTLRCGLASMTVPLTQPGGAYVAASMSGTGNSRVITVKANGSWSASTDENWIHLNSNAGKEDGVITLTLDANTTSSVRTGRVTIECGSSRETVTITQEKTDHVSAQVEGGGIHYVIHVTANGSWTATSDSMWIALDKVGGIGPDTINVTLTPGPAGTFRSGTVQLTCGSCSIVVPISQDGRDYILATQSGTGSSRVISVKANGSWTATADQPWIHLIRDSGNGDGVLTVRLDMNETDNERRGHVTLVCGSSQDTVEIVQPRPVRLSAVVRGSGNRQTIDITANCAWTVSTDAAWITTDKRSGDGDGVITVTLAKNTTGSERTGRVILKYSEGEKYIFFTQSDTDR